MKAEMLGTDIESWPVDLRSEFEKSVSTVREAEGKRLGEIMFRYRDTLGLTKETIDVETRKVMESKEYKTAFANLVVRDMANRGVGVTMTKAQSLEEA